MGISNSDWNYSGKRFRNTKKIIGLVRLRKPKGDLFCKARILKWIYATGPRARGFAIKGSEVEIFTRNFSL
jgi:hypothetical protein